MPPDSTKTVRDYISPADSAAVIDMIRLWSGEPNIDEIYSKNVAGMPVERGSMIKYMDLAQELRGIGQIPTAGFIRPEEEGDKPSIILDSMMYDFYNDMKEFGDMYIAAGATGYPTANVDNTIHHEAFGHALIDAMHVYNELPIPEHITPEDDYRVELFPALIESYVNLLHPERLGQGKWVYENIKAAEELDKLAKESLSELLAQIQSRNVGTDIESPVGSSFEDALGLAKAQEKARRMKAIRMELPPMGASEMEAWD